MTATARQFGGLKWPAAFRAKAKRIIYLLQSGAPSQMDLFDYKPNLDEFRGADLPDSIRNGPAPDGHDLGAEKVPRRALDLQIQAVRQSPDAWLSELLPHTARDCRRHLLHQIAVHRSDQPRSGDHVFSDRLAIGGPAQLWLVGLATAWAARTRTCPRSSC